MLLEFEFSREGDDLLHLADVAFKYPDAALGVQVPQPNGAVIRGREHGAGLGVNPHCVHPVRMSAQETGRLVLKVPDLDGSVHRRRRKNGRIEVQTDNTSAVSGIRRDALASTPVPHLQAEVHAAADQLGIIKLETPDARLVTPQRLQLLACLGVPDLDSSIVRPGRQDVVFKLEAHNAIAVSGEPVD